MDNFNKEGTAFPDNTQPFMPYGYQPYSIVPDRRKRGNGIKALLWSSAVFMVLISAGIMALGMAGSGNIDFVIDVGGSYRDGLPSNSYSGSSYATNTDIPDAPNASADINGPQISAVMVTNDDVSKNSANAAYTTASPSVVNITSYEAGTDYALTKSGDGSGIIITSDGYISTNSHVVNDSKDTGVMITLFDGSQYLGTVIGIDKKTDLAVVKIDESGLKAAQFADSDKIYVGQDAYAIGSPGGAKFSNSLTKGTVSAVNRIVSGGYVRYIQTDAAINPGNSGGALINSDGQVIGVNTIKFVGTDYEGMGFAIPSNQVIKIVNELIRYGAVKSRGTLGIEGKNCSLYESKMKNVPQGIIITKINYNSPLYTSPARENDIITAVNGVVITDFAELIDELGKFKPDDEVILTIFHVPEQKNMPPDKFDIAVTLISDE